MKNHYIAFLVFPILFILGIGCYHKSNDSDSSCLDPSLIYGSWSMDLTNGNFRGNERITFLPSNLLVIEDSLVFCGQDSGFSFKLPINVSLEGNWELKRDSIFIKYSFESFDLRVDQNNIIIESTGNNADQKVFSSLKKEMEDELLDYIEGYLTNSYESNSNQQLLLGRVISQKIDSLLLILNDTQFYLWRIKDL